MNNTTEFQHFNNRMNGANTPPLINYSPTGQEMAKIFRELESSGKKVDAAIVTKKALAKGINKSYLNACLDYVEDEDIPNHLISLSIQEYLSYEFPERENIIAPWLPSQGLCEIFAARGIGKTHFALGVAVAVAAGGTFLGWEAQDPHGVVLVDGELPGVVLQTWLQEIIGGAAAQPTAQLNIITPDLQKDGMPNLATIEGQEMVEACITDKTKLIVLDNISIYFT